MKHDPKTHGLWLMQVPLLNGSVLPICWCENCGRISMYRQDSPGAEPGDSTESIQKVFDGFTRAFSADSGGAPSPARNAARFCKTGGCDNTPNPETGYCPRCMRAITEIQEVERAEAEKKKGPNEPKDPFPVDKGGEVPAESGDAK